MLSYQTILEDMATAIEALSPSAGGYAEDDSDRWHRMRGVGPSDEDWEHLGFKIHFGLPKLSGRPNCLSHEGCVVEWMQRTSADDTFASQGRLIDSGIDLMGLLVTWGIPAIGCRVVPEGVSMVEADGEYVKNRVPFHMIVTNWRA